MPYFNDELDNIASHLDKNNQHNPILGLQKDFSKINFNFWVAKFKKLTLDDDIIVKYRDYFFTVFMSPETYTPFASKYSLRKRDLGIEVGFDKKLNLNYFRIGSGHFST